MGLEDREYMRDEDDLPVSAGAPMSTTTKLFMANLAVFVVHALSSTGGSSPVDKALRLDPSAMFEVWRFVSYAFCHATVPHFAISMLGLYMFGSLVEQAHGRGGLLKLYALAAIGGGAVWVLAGRGGGAVYLVGSSAVVMALMINGFLRFPRHHFAFMPYSTLVMLVLFADVCMVMFSRSHPAIVAHAGGLLVGIGHAIATGACRWPGWLAQLSMGRQAEGARPHAPPPRPPADEAGDDEEPAYASEDEMFTAEIDPILDKIGKHGMKSLSRRERRILERAREQMKSR
jgi:membrane associated rhomboid family serine protease